MIALGIALAATGVILAPKRRERRKLALTIAFSATLFVVPVATAIYQRRYGIPATTLLVVAAARGAEIAALRLRRLAQRG